MRKKEKIVMKDNKIITKKRIFEEKAQFHKEQAKISFEEKIKILVELQKISNKIKGENRIVWII